MADKLKLSTPWMTYLHELEALFGDDPAVQVVYNDNNDDKEITLFVHGSEKADALTQLLPVKKDFGNVSVKVTVKPANEDTYVPSKFDLMRVAFDGNPVVSYMASTDAIFPINYVVFQNKVVQFYNDQLDDPRGYKSTLYQEIAKDVFDGVPGIYYCTDVPVDNDGKSLGAPLGEWP